MESLSFKNLPIIIYGSLSGLTSISSISDTSPNQNYKYVVATNINFNTTNSLSELKSIGFHTSFGEQFPNNFLSNNVSFQYLIQNDDPVKSIIDFLKTGSSVIDRNNNDAPSFVINIGGLSGTVYLENFSLNMNPGTVANAQASFISYVPFSGQIGKFTMQKNQTINADFLHGDMANINISNSNQNIEQDLNSAYYGFNYNFRVGYTPISTIGTNYPKTVKYNGILEELEVTDNLYRRIFYTGESKNINLNLSAICAPDIDYIIYMSGAKSISTNSSSQNNGIVTTLRKFTKYY